ncbi:MULTISPECIES: MarR family winged helix-turn-helix transcriptional regulator [Paenibacillus]|uniref:MarR family transcriptional regulator n=2 Tax=Paenibacillus TaxID=44249 RepID=A0A2V4UZD0_PAEBA|nr:MULTISPECIES: MarR family transcriptional regulator [Paenibacillus]MCK6073258.1 MarR family transcriptional regulator [Paenibacillus silvae]MCK6149266.1 MarR family transcriptional regulator [Paenibacillus silvae]MCK6267565.1 MarR family transcriptional regulator [Paenibacillus silvae]PYE45453.1 MarR family transcriptional regulator [Paenibacillus barcinonensis]QKS55268.1 MarR family transcriptional regulator [Paenibacillus barcinonensis]
MDLYHITGFLIHRTDVKLTNYFTKQLKPYEVTPEQWSIISYLDPDKAMTQKELAEAIDRDQTTVVRMIHSLERKGMVRRMMNDQDKRSHHLYLSSKGQEVKERLLLTVKEAHDHVTRGLEPDELDQLKVTLDKLYRNVRED